VVEVHYGVGSYQPLAEGKGVHREVESEGSRRQNPKLKNTNNIRHILMGWVCQTKRSPITTRVKGVNVVVTWMKVIVLTKGYLTDVRRDYGSTDNNCYENSAEVIVEVDTCLKETKKSGGLTKRRRTEL